MVRINVHSKPLEYKNTQFTRADLLRIGAKAIQAIQKRCARGQDVNDHASKPLSPSYRAKKIAMGQPGIRNQMFSGSLLGALTIVEADQNKVTIGFTRQAELIKASKTDEKGKWFGLSKVDEGVVFNFAGRILQGKSK